MFYCLIERILLSVRPSIYLLSVCLSYATYSEMTTPFNFKFSLRDATGGVQVSMRGGVYNYYFVESTHVKRQMKAAN